MKYKYTLEQKIKNAPWFYVNTFNSLDDVIRHLDYAIKSDIRYKRIYFVYNDFFNNVYPEDISNKKYRILCRSVGEWEEFKGFLNFFK